MHTGMSLRELQRWFLPVLFLISYLPYSFATPGEGITLPDGSVYHGALKDGQFDGIGRLEWANGRRYEGEFRDGLMAGSGMMYGVFYGASGNTYIGDFVDDRARGTMRIEYANGDIYDGEMTARSPTGNPTGRGCWSWLAGRVTWEASSMANWKVTPA